MCLGRTAAEGEEGEAQRRDDGPVCARRALRQAEQAQVLGGGQQLEALHFAERHARLLSGAQQARLLHKAQQLLLLHPGGETRVPPAHVRRGARPERSEPQDALLQEVARLLLIVLHKQPRADGLLLPALLEGVDLLKRAAGSGPGGVSC